MQICCFETKANKQMYEKQFLPFYFSSCLGKTPPQDQGLLKMMTVSFILKFL